MDVGHLQYFMSIASGLTFEEAAAKHNISTSALSKIIQRLEYELDVKLFDRSRRNAVLTKAGSVLYEDLQLISPGFKMLKQHMSQYALTKSLNYCVVPSPNIDLARHLTSFANKHPEIKTTADEQRNANVAYDMLYSSKYDFLIMHEPLSVQNDFSITNLRDDRIVVVMPSHRAPKEAAISIDKLKNETFLLNSVTNNIFQDIQSYFPITPHVKKTFLSRQDLLLSVSMDEGVAIFYESESMYLQLNNIAILPIIDCPASPLSLIALKQNSLTEAQRKFKNFLVSQFHNSSLEKAIKS